MKKLSEKIDEVLRKHSCLGKQEIVRKSMTQDIIRAVKEYKHFVIGEYETELYPHLKGETAEQFNSVEYKNEAMSIRNDLKNDQLKRGIESI